MSRNIEFVGARIFNPAGIVVLAFGIWMVLDLDVYEFSQAWIIIGIGGLAASALLGALYFGPQSKTLVAEYEAGDETAGDARLARVANMAVLDNAILFFVVWAMVAKPGL